MISKRIEIHLTVNPRKQETVDQALAQTLRAVADGLEAGASQGKMKHGGGWSLRRHDVE